MLGFLLDFNQSTYSFGVDVQVQTVFAPEVAFVFENVFLVASFSLLGCV